MALDLSEIDGQLEALGEMPRELDARASGLVGGLRSLSEVDDALSKLAEGASEPSPMPDVTPRLVSSRPPEAPPVRAPALQDAPVDLFADNFLADDADDAEERKLLASLSKSHVEPAAAAWFDERDPDAEFDSLFDEATPPKGIPARDVDPGNGEHSADDLLIGMVALPPYEKDAFTVDLSADLPGEPSPPQEELGSSEFEIVLDAEGEVKDLVSSHPPSAPDGDKRPSFLGRLFGRKDEA